MLSSGEVGPISTPGMNGSLASTSKPPTLETFRGHLHPKGVSKPKNQVNASRYPVIRVSSQGTLVHDDGKHSPKENKEIH